MKEEVEHISVNRNIPKTEKVDCCLASGYRKHLKTRKVRSERRRANIDPECTPAYNRFQGWEN